MERTVKSHLEKLSEAGERPVPMEVARDISGALVELRSKHIIHRDNDMKSENALIDLDGKRADVVKLCDFDRAVPLRSLAYTDACVVCRHSSLDVPRGFPGNA